MRIVFGSCRVAAPHEPPHTLRKDEHPDGREVDALRGLALRMRHRRPRSGRTRCCCSATRSTPTRSTRHVEDELDGERGRVTYDDYVDALHRGLGRAGDPLAALDGPERDDLRRPRRPRRLEHVDRVGHRDAPEGRGGAGGSSPPSRATSIYQHLGNLSPQRARRVRALRAPAHGRGPDAARCASSPGSADEEVQGTRWSFCRDIGPARVVMIDSRAGRVLDPGNRAMVDHDEWRWITEHATGDVDHLLIGTSLPLIMGPAMHWLEAWNEVVADGAWGKRRQEARREAAPGARPRALAGVPGVVPAHVRPAARGRRRASRRGAVDDLRALAATSTTPTWPRSASRRARACESAVWQAVCSPFRNPLDSKERRVILGAWTQPAGR